MRMAGKDEDGDYNAAIDDDDDDAPETLCLFIYYLSLSPSLSLPPSLSLSVSLPA